MAAWGGVVLFPTGACECCRVRAHLLGMKCVSGVPILGIWLGHLAHVIRAFRDRYPPGVPSQ